MSEPLLEVDGLAAGYGDALVLHGVSLVAAPGELVCIVGPNGAGKSTLLKAVYGLVRPRGGSVRLAGEEIGGMRPDRLTRHGLNFVPQLDNVFPLLRERRRQRAGTLSGGQRKLVALARALVTSPRLLLVDEPSAGLAPQVTELVFAKLAEINALGIAIVMVEQNARRGLALAHTGYVLDMGRNAFSGPGSSLLDDPNVAELYLGGSSTTASSSTSTSAPSGTSPPTK